MKFSLVILVTALAFASVSQGQSTGDVQLGVKSSTGELTPVWITKTAGKVIGWNDAGVLGPITVGSGGGSGTVTSVALSLPGIFSVSGSPVTTSGTLAAALANQSANLIWAGPASGSAAAPAFRALVADDLPNLSAVYQPYLGTSSGGNGSADQGKLVRFEPAGAGWLQVTDYLRVRASFSSSVLASYGPQNIQFIWGVGDYCTLLPPADSGAYSFYLPSTTGTHTIALEDGNITGTAGGLSSTLDVTSGGTGQTTFADGQLLIGNTTGNTLTKATLTQGTGITITNGAGSITIAAAPPLSSITDLGTGIAAALAINTGSAGAMVLYNGAGGTPSAITLTNGTGLPVSGITSSTSTALGVGSLEIGHASDTTLSRASAGVAAIEGNNILVSGGPLGTPASGTATNLTGTASGMTAGQATAALGLKTATTTVSVSSATAPSADDVLTATSSTTAEWKPPSGGGIGGSTGAADNAIIRADGTGGATIQAGAAATLSDAGHITAERFVNGVGGPYSEIYGTSTGFYTAAGALRLATDFGSYVMVNGLCLSTADDTYLFRSGAGTVQFNDRTNGGGRAEFYQVSSGGTPNANCARIFAKDVSGTSELFVMDEAGNETQISPHNTNAPESLVDSAFDEIGYTANYFTGIITYTNKQRQIVGRPDAQFFETFEEHNERLNLQGRERLVIADWDANQAAQVAKSQEAHDVWLDRKTAWLANPKNAGKTFAEAEPVIVSAKPKPQWLIAQLAGKEAFLAARPAAGVAVSMTSMRLALIDAQLLQPVLNVLEAMPDPVEKLKVKTWWETAQNVTRNHPLVLSLASALGQTPEQVDALFQAAKLKDATP